MPRRALTIIPQRDDVRLLPRLAWRYLASKGCAPLAPLDPVGHALARLQAEMHDHQTRSARLATACSGTTLILTALLTVWMTFGQATILLDLAVRVVATITLLREALCARDAACHWLFARGILRCLAANDTENAFSRVLSSQLTANRGGRHDET